MTVLSTPTPHLLPVLKAYIEQDQKLRPGSPKYADLVTLQDLIPRHILIATKFIPCTVTIHINRTDSLYDESDPIHLRSVMSAYRPEDYRLPGWGSLAYTAEKPTSPYHDRTFHPSKIDFVLHDDGKRFSYRLVSRRQDVEFDLRRIGPAELFSVFAFYCEEIDERREFPVHVLFKKAEDGRLWFHTTLVPLALMELVVLDSGRRRGFN